MECLDAKYTELISWWQNTGHNYAGGQTSAIWVANGTRECRGGARKCN